MRAVHRSGRGSRSSRSARRVVGTAVAWATLALANAGCSAGEAANGTGTWSAESARQAPIVIAPRRIALLDVDAAEWRAVAAAFLPAHPVERKRPDGDGDGDGDDGNVPQCCVPPGIELGPACCASPGDDGPAEAKWRTNPSYALHALRLHTVDASFSAGPLPSGDAVLRALTDRGAGRDVFGADVMAATRWGVRYRPRSDLYESRTSADEAHTDQTFAGLVELGVALTRPVEVAAERRFTLNDVLADMIASFHLEARELEWTAVALATCVPPATRWRNRFGESFGFDDLARRLAEKGFDGVSCGGTHVFYAMVVLLRVHEQVPILSIATERVLEARVRELTELVRNNQREDGSWDQLWFRAPDDPLRASAPPDPTGTRLLITGHLGECLLRLPDRLQPEDERYRRAGEWLWPALRDGVASGSLHTEFCPYTHAACVVQALRQP